MFVLLAFPDAAAAMNVPVPAPPAEMAGKGPVIRALFAISVLAVPFLLSFFPLYAALRGVKVYEQFTEGAKEAFGVAQRIVPFLVAMLVAIRMLREAGVIDLLTRTLSPVLSAIHFPADLLPMVLMRPLSGSATQGLFVELINRLGPDTLTSRIAGTIYGSTETTCGLFRKRLDPANAARRGRRAHRRHRRGDRFHGDLHGGVPLRRGAKLLILILNLNLNRQPARASSRRGD